MDELRKNGEYSCVIEGCTGEGLGVTRIGGRAFEGCMNLRSATIPASVTEMGVNVFIGIKPSPTVIVNVSSRN